MRGWNSAVYLFISFFAFIAVLAEPAYADPMALWNIVTRQCVPQFEKGEAPIPPCEHVDIAGGKDRGYVYFKDRVGVAQMLTIPIRRLTGIEEPALLEPDTPNYFADAWARALLRGSASASVVAARGGRDLGQFHGPSQPGPVALPRRLRRQ